MFKLQFLKLCFKFHKFSTNAVTFEYYLFWGFEDYVFENNNNLRSLRTSYTKNQAVKNNPIPSSTSVKCGYIAGLTGEAYLLIVVKSKSSSCKKWKFFFIFAHQCGILVMALSICSSCTKSSLLGGFKHEANSVDKTWKSKGTLDNWKLQVGTNSSKHKQLIALKIAKRIGHLPSNTVRWQVDKQLNMHNNNFGHSL